MNAVLQEDQPVWAQVSLAQCLDSVHPAPCTDAEVLLYVDGEFAERLQHGGDGFYIGETCAEALHDYSCKVFVPGFDTLFASTEMPERPKVFDVNIIEKALVNDEGLVCPAFLVSFGNNPTQKQFFSASLNLLIKWKDESKGNRDWIDGYHIASGTLNYSYQADDPVLLNEGSQRLLFSNALIQDTIYSLKEGEVKSKLLEIRAWGHTYRTIFLFLAELKETLYRYESIDGDELGHTVVANKYCYLKEEQVGFVAGFYKHRGFL